jgi:hypothetical protein
MFNGADDRRFKGRDEDSDEFREYAAGGGGSIEDVCADLVDLVIVGDGADPMLLELRTVLPAEGDDGTEPFIVERGSVRIRMIENWFYKRQQRSSDSHGHCYVDDERLSAATYTLYLSSRALKTSYFLLLPNLLLPFDSRNSFAMQQKLSC